jgi:hypothetical protein
MDMPVPLLPPSTQELPVLHGGPISLKVMSLCLAIISFWELGRPLLNLSLLKFIDREEGRHNALVLCV